MPYIPPDRRHELRPACEPAIGPGELNYQITSLIRQYLDSRWKVDYRALNDVLGALEGAKAEFYRRVVVPFEEEKRAANGDVYS